MGKAVQHPGILTELLNGQTVILLIQEKACLLTVLHIHQIADIVFHDFHIGIKGFADKAFDTLHALFFPFPGVASLIDAADRDAILFQNTLQFFNNRLFHPIDTQRQRLYHQHIRELIYDHTRNPVRLAENHTAAGSVHRLLPILPGRFYTVV